MKKVVFNFISVILVVASQAGELSHSRLNRDFSSRGIEVQPNFDEIFVPFEETVDRRCPIGTTLNGNECVDRLSNECPRGFEWKNDRCVTTQTNCPLDYDWDGRTCVQRKTCPPGWTWNGVICEMKDIYCQPGFVRKGNECVQNKLNCPTGQTFSSTSNSCVITKHSCPPGSIMQNNKCKSTIVSCPEETYRVGDKCYPRRIEYETTTYRPMRFPFSAQRSAVNAYCPEGYTLHNNFCFKCRN